jgi:hypothetical protein
VSQIGPSQPSQCPQLPAGRKETHGASRRVPVFNL